MSLVDPVCCWTPAGERVLLIEKSSNGSGKIYRRGAIVELNCYDVALLLLQDPIKREQQPQPKACARPVSTAAEYYAARPGYMTNLQRQVERQLGPMPTTALAASQPRPTEVVEALKLERQQLIEERRQGRQRHRRQRDAAINQQIDALLQQVWSRQQARPTASDRQLVAA